MERTREQLKKLQELPLYRKVGFTVARITEFYNKTNGKCYVSCSKGKDSLVLLHIARKIYPNIPAVFCDTGLEYPEVKNLPVDNLTVIRPTVSFKEVLEKYGYPVQSKEVSQTIYKARMGQKDAIAKLNGTRVDTKTGKISQYNIPQHKHFLSAPFRISHMCCEELKKKPFKRYEKMTGNKPILATMAAESSMRRTNWLRYGCNSFNGKRTISQPMSFWTEQDVLRTIYYQNIKIPSVYGELVQNTDSVSLGLSGVSRTGCIFCLYGLKYDGTEDRFHKLEKSHPALYEYCMNALGLKEVLEYLRRPAPRARARASLDTHLGQCYYTTSYANNA